MKQEIYYIYLNGKYDKQTICQYMQYADTQHIENIVFMEKDSQFYEFSFMYEELYHTYPQQKHVLPKNTSCSIQSYQAFIQEMKQCNISKKVQFGISVQYLPQYEHQLKNMIDPSCFDIVLGEVLCIDNMMYHEGELSDQMLWNKYNHSFLYRRYFELVYAMITSQLFHGILGVDRIYQVGYQMPNNLERLYNKISQKLMINHMHVYFHQQDVVDQQFEKVLAYYKVKTMQIKHDIEDATNS